MIAATASWYCSRNIESPSAALNDLPDRFWSYQSGRGYDPVMAVGSIMSRVTRTIHSSADGFDEGQLVLCRPFIEWDAAPQSGCLSRSAGGAGGRARSMAG